MEKGGNLTKKFKIAENYTSLALGILVVVVIGALIFNYTSRRVKQPRPEMPTQEEVTPSPGQPVQVSLPAKHTIVAGEDLWKISEKYYQTGFNWVYIARENKLSNPNLLYTGTELTIPKVELGTLPAAGIGITAISGTSYTAVKGDNLWNIAVRAYGDGFKWVEIARANNLANPDLIHPGNVFTLPR